MKKLGTVFVCALFVLPTITYAQTTAEKSALIQTLVQLVVKLEAQIQQILAERASNITSTIPQAQNNTSNSDTVGITIQALPQSQTTIGSGFITFDSRFSVNTSDITIDIPQNAVGVEYEIDGIKDNAATTFVLNCPQSATYDGTSYCEIPPNTIENLELVVKASSMDKISGSKPQLTVNQIKYYINVNTTSQSFTYYKTSGIQTLNNYLKLI